MLKCIMFVFKFFAVSIYEYLRYVMLQKPYTEFISNYVKRLARCNPLYVKLFQAFALHNEIIDETFNDELLHFTDNAPWSKDDIDYETIIMVCNDYNLRMESCIPINSGMISLVFKLTCNETLTPVILKLKRTNIDVKLMDGLEELTSCICIADCLPYVRKYKLYEILGKKMALIRNQLDFEKEVLNTQIMFENFKNISYVEIPCVHKNVTSKYPNAILMNYIQGECFKNVKEEDYLQYAECVLKFGIVSCFVHGFSHGDLHPGNILFLKKNVNSTPEFKIAIIDFGITYTIDKTVQQHIFELADNLFHKGSSRDVADNLIKSGIFVGPIEKINDLEPCKYESLLQIFTNFIDTSKNKSATIYYKIFETLKEFSIFMQSEEIKDRGLHVSDDILNFQLCITMACGITLKLCKNKDYFQFVDECLNKVFHLDLLNDKKEIHK